VQHNGDIGVSSKNGRDVIIRLAGVNHRRLTRFGSEGKLCFEGAMLQGTRRVIVVEVESGLSDGDDPGVSEHATKPLLRLLAPALCIMRMNAGSGRETGVGGGQGQGGFGAATGLSDHHNAAYPCRPGALQHIGQIGCVGRIGQVAVSVDQHVGATSSLRSSLPA
jgi:hypothetical protein